MGNLIILFSIILIVFLRDTMSTGTAALVVTAIVSILDFLNWLVRMACELESDSVAIERLREYEELPREDVWFTHEKENCAPLEKWPENGSISFEDYSTKYRAGLKEVVKLLNFDIHDGEKLGICGRTGAGKSSLTLAIFRIIEATAGRIRIAERDISTVGLQDLRSQITIIPQDPVLFSGSLRMNLDPNCSFGDADIWKALGQAHMKEHVSRADGLDQSVDEGGKNFSVGQRQLICLAR